MTNLNVVKESNPKDAIGSRKAPMSTVSAPVMAEIGLGMLEGACKYGRHNYRAIGVRSSVYYDAAMRHQMAWWEGQDIDPASGLSHITKAICSLVVLRDAMINGKMHDDRPPPCPDGWGDRLNAEAERLIDAAPVHKEPYTKESKPLYGTSPALAAVKGPGLTIRKDAVDTREWDYERGRWAVKPKVGDRVKSLGPLPAKHTAGVVRYLPDDLSPFYRVQFDCGWYKMLPEEFRVIENA